MKSKFFEFCQNNSGGSFGVDKKAGIGHYVIIEAMDADHANTIAERIGIYFDGCQNGMDCDCCGDRWYPAYGEGDDVISHYGTPLIDAGNRTGFFPRWEDEYFFVHFLDGRIGQAVLLKDKTYETVKIKQLT